MKRLISLFFVLILVGCTQTDQTTNVSEPAEMDQAADSNLRDGRFELKLVDSQVMNLPGKGPCNFTTETYTSDDDVEYIIAYADLDIEAFDYLLGSYFIDDNATDINGVLVYMKYALPDNKDSFVGIVWYEDGKMYQLITNIPSWNKPDYDSMIEFFNFYRSG